MKSIQVGQFKAEFSSILETVQKSGEKYIIEYGRKHKKIAMLVPYKEEKVRKFGQLKGKILIPNNFNDENENINDMFYGSKI